MRIGSNIFLIVSLLVFVSCGNKQSAEQDETSSTTKANPDTLSATGTEKTIVFFGNSLTAGYGLDQLEAFPALIELKLDSLNLPYKTVNAGVSGETSAGGNARIDWILNQPVHIFVLELGANDGLRGIPISETRKNLQAIIDKVKAKYPDAKLVLAGMQLPPNLGQSYTSEFRNLYPELAEKNNAALIPFLLEGVGGEARFNQEDGIHPTAEGHRVVAENVWNVLKGLL